MTPEDRKQAFANEYNQLVKKYGVVIDASLQIEQFSRTVAQQKVVVDMALVDNWQPLEPKKD